MRVSLDVALGKPGAAPRGIADLGKGAPPRARRVDRCSNGLLSVLDPHARRRLSHGRLNASRLDDIVSAAAAQRATLIPEGP